MTGFMLLMIVLIGAVNIVSTLVMVVADKGADIAILRTMGASRKTIMAIFMVQGVVAGLLGTLLGLVLGVLLALNITDLSLLLEGFINEIFAGSNIYLISHLQSELVWGDVALVGVAALVISFLATLYPAYRAANIQPAEVLRYE
jgi:lipoprotein-releasing system permease protein